MIYTYLYPSTVCIEPWVNRGGTVQWANCIVLGLGFCCHDITG